MINYNLSFVFKFKYDINIKEENIDVSEFHVLDIIDID
jgi:hypothetical protein